MTTNLDDLTTPWTREEVEARIYADLEADGLHPAQWKPNSPARMIITGYSVVLAAMSSLSAAIAKGGLLELAAGDWLTLYARHVYGVERQTGSFAAGSVTITNTGALWFQFDPDDLVLSSADGTRTYRNTASFALRPGETVSVPVQAEELGTVGNAIAGEITGFVTPLLGVTATNPTALRGSDPENDRNLRFRCTAKIGTLGPCGSRSAYYFFARSAKRADGTGIGVTRARTIADGRGHVDLYVATASGEVTGTPGDVSTDLGAIDRDVHAGAVPEGVTCTTHTATGVPIAVTYEVWLHETSEIAALSDGQIKAQIAASLDGFLGDVDVGGQRRPGQPGRVYQSAIAASIAGAYPDAFVDLQITIPAGDVDIGPTEVPKGGVHVGTIHRVAVE